MAKTTKPPAKGRKARSPATTQPAANAKAKGVAKAKGAAKAAATRKPGGSAPAKAGRPATVAAYLAALPPDRREAVSAVRDAMNRALPAGYEEGMAWGMITWHVPHRLYPAGYHCDPSQPLPFAGLASQKGHMSLHLMAVYLEPERRAGFEAAWRATGKKLDMGAACVRFKALDDLALDVVTSAVARIPVADYVAAYEAVRARGTSKR